MGEGSVGDGQGEAPGAKRRAALGFVAVLVVIVGLAGVLRGASSVAVVQPDRVELTGPGDPYYHLRRVVYAAVNFPESLSVDPYLNFPTGGAVVWPATFDSGVAAVARVLAGSDVAAIERVAVWAPAVLGAIAAGLAAVVAGVYFGGTAGTVAGLLVALLPVHLMSSQVGQLDHHVAVNGFTLALLAAGLSFVGGGAALGRSIALGVAFAGGLLLWPGALVHVGLLQGILGVWVLGAATCEEARRRAHGLAIAHVVAGVVLAPFCLGRVWPEFGAWSPFVLSNVQPIWFASGAVALLVAAELWRRTPLGEGPLSRAGSAFALVAAGIGVALLAQPALREALLEGAGWFGKAEDFQTHVAELAPLSPQTALLDYTPLLLAFPLVWAWLWKREEAAPLRVLLAFAGAFFVLACVQQRFGNSFSVLLAVVSGVAAQALWRSWRRDASGNRSLVAFGLLLALATTAALGRFHLQRFAEVGAARADPILARRGPLPERFHAVSRAADWLGDHSPETSGWLDARQRPEYGVLSAWDAGHLVRYRARRPMLQDNFGVYGGRENYEAAWRFYASEDEATGVALLAARDIRYVLADEAGAGTPVPYAPTSIAMRMARALGSETVLAGADGARVTVEALRHHRLVHYARSGAGQELPARLPEAAVGVWERVAGARVEGSAAPGAAVEAVLPLEIGGARTRYRQTARADARGRYTLVLPYATEAAAPGRGGVRVGRAYVLRAASGRARLVVPEAAVQEGRALEGPTL